MAIAFDPRDLIRDFTKRQKAFHADERAFDLEEIAAKGGMEKEINLALQKLRQKGLMALQEEQQRFDQPLREAQIAGFNADTAQKMFDLGIGRRYTDRLLQGKLSMNDLYRQYLSRAMGLGTMEGKTGPLPLDENPAIAPLETLPLRGTQARRGVPDPFAPFDVSSVDKTTLPGYRPESEFGPLLRNRSMKRILSRGLFNY